MTRRSRRHIQELPDVSRKAAVGRQISLEEQRRAREIVRAPLRTICPPACPASMRKRLAPQIRPPKPRAGQTCSRCPFWLSPACPSLRRDNPSQFVRFLPRLMTGECHSHTTKRPLCQTKNVSMSPPELGPPPSCQVGTLEGAREWRENTDWERRCNRTRPASKVKLGMWVPAS